jgi:hypothetical protein
MPRSNLWDYRVLFARNHGGGQLPAFPAPSQSSRAAYRITRACESRREAAQVWLQAV